MVYRAILCLSLLFVSCGAEAGECGNGVCSPVQRLQAASRVKARLVAPLARLRSGRCGR